MPTLAPDMAGVPDPPDAARAPRTAAAPESGAVLFARYAYGPNRLGLCGPNDAAALLAAGSDARAAAGVRQAPRRAREQERLLRDRAAGFEGAFPYLELIARSSGIADPLDRRVVESYWLGTGLEASVRERALGNSLDARFRRRMPARTWRWLAETPTEGARPVHAFHVLDVFPKVGLLRDGPSAGVVETIESCRIRWGIVEGINGDWLDVRAPAIRLVDGRLSLGPAVRMRVRRAVDGVGFLPPIDAGDTISMHWSWACDRLTPTARRALEMSTRRELAIANRSI
jgi:Family of unknown function (DUF6390)